jgi:hypothetical protein
VDDEARMTDREDFARALAAAVEALVRADDEARPAVARAEDLLAVSRALEAAARAARAEARALLRSVVEA